MAGPPGELEIDLMYWNPIMTRKTPIRIRISDLQSRPERPKSSEIEEGSLLARLIRLQQDADHQRICGLGISRA